ncbi:MAG: diguanylate cyclase domain-containing protein [Trueperaceae bacterium]
MHAIGNRTTAAAPGTTPEAEVATLVAVVLEVTARLAGALDAELPAAITAALELVAGATGVERARVFEVASDGATLTSTHEWLDPTTGIEPDVVAGMPVSAYGPYWAQLQRGESVEVHDLVELADAPVRDRLAAQHVRSLLWIPMPGPRPCGYVGFATMRAPRRWSPADLDLLRATTNVVGEALARRRSVLERNDEHVRLTRLSELVAGALLQVHIDATGASTLRYASARTADLLGSDAARAPSDAAWLLHRVHPDDVGTVTTRMRAGAAAGSEWSAEFRVADAPERWLQAQCTPEPDGAGGTIWHCLFTDVTERRRAQARAEEDAGFRRALIDLTNALMGADDPGADLDGELARALLLVPGTAGGVVLLGDGPARYRAAAAVGYDLARLQRRRWTSPTATASGAERARLFHDGAFAKGWSDAERRAFDGARHGDPPPGHWRIVIAVGATRRGFVLLDADGSATERDHARTASFIEAVAAQLGAALGRRDLEHVLRQERERFERLASLDPLTHLPNRRTFRARLDQTLAGARRHGREAGVVFLDLDDFKAVNDELGHDAGDDLLIEVARRLRAAVRAEDTVARLGGDEFAVVIDALASRSALAHLETKLHAAIAEPLVLHGRSVSVSSSVGSAAYPRDGRTAADLVRHADTEMYGVKRGSRARRPS